MDALRRRQARTPGIQALRLSEHATGVHVRTPVDGLSQDR